VIIDFPQSPCWFVFGLDCRERPSLCTSSCWGGSGRPLWYELSRRGLFSACRLASAPLSAAVVARAACAALRLCVQNGTRGVFPRAFVQLRFEHVRTLARFRSLHPYSALLAASLLRFLCAMPWLSAFGGSCIRQQCMMSGSRSGACGGAAPHHARPPPPRHARYFHLVALLRSFVRSRGASWRRSGIAPTVS
jgi:hypothetical protein